VTATKFTKKQIAKDTELILNKDIDGATWHFFISPTTGKGGASKNVLKLLEDSGIDYFNHFK